MRRPSGGGAAAADRSPLAGLRAKHIVGEAMPAARFPAAAPKAGMAGTRSTRCPPASRGARLRPDSGSATNGPGGVRRLGRERVRLPRRSRGGHAGRAVRGAARRFRAVRGSAGPSARTRRQALRVCRRRRGRSAADRPDRDLPSRSRHAPIGSSIFSRAAATAARSPAGSPPFPGSASRRSIDPPNSRAGRNAARRDIRSPGFSARRQLRIVSNSPSSASSPRRIAGNKRFLNSIVCARWTTLSRAGTTRTARSASPRARQAPPGRLRPGR